MSRERHSANVSHAGPVAKTRKPKVFWLLKQAGARMVSEQIGVVNVGLWHVRSCAATRPAFWYLRDFRNYHPEDPLSGVKPSLARGRLGGPAIGLALMPTPLAQS
jgi:hypothetical protein